MKKAAIIVGAVMVIAAAAMTVAYKTNDAVHEKVNEKLKG